MWKLLCCGSGSLPVEPRDGKPNGAEHHTEADDGETIAPLNLRELAKEDLSERPSAMNASMKVKRSSQVSTSAYVSMQRKSAQAFAERMSWTPEEFDAAAQTEPAENAKASATGAESQTDGGVQASSATSAANMVETFKAIIIAGAEAEQPSYPEAKASKADILQIFGALKIKLDTDVFDQLFQMFDAENQGGVDLANFATSFCCLSFRSQDCDNLELAFRLFNSKRDGYISKRQFNDLVAAVMGSRVETLLSIEIGKKALTAFVESEFATELLTFYLFVGELSSRHPDMIPLADAQALFTRFLAVGADEQVNVSDDVREACNVAVTAGSAEDGVPTTFLDVALAETRRMIEQGALIRFKARLRKTTEFFADEVWELSGMADGDLLSLEQYRAWATQNQPLFQFFDALQTSIERCTSGMSFSGPATSEAAGNPSPGEACDESLEQQ